MNALGGDFNALDVRPDIEQAPWSDLLGADHGVVRRIGLLRNGTTGGRASLVLAIQLDDGRWVVAETTYRLFRTATRALAASPVAAEET
jgi:hypothetical protein